MRIEEVHIRYGHCLPHWTAADATYFVTFRLADSLPRRVLEDWRNDIDRSVRAFESRLGRAARPEETARIRRKSSKKVEDLLDSGAGSCLMSDPRCAAIVRDALQHFHGDRYELGAWCVMPNHAHAVVKPLSLELNKIVGGWKGFTAKEINKLLGLNGQRWQEEPFDHLVRDEADYDKFTVYVLSNPEQARLNDWPWIGVGSEGQSSSPVPGESGRGELGPEGQE